MQHKLIVIVSFAAALTTSGAGSTSAQSTLGGCPELRSACQPIGNRPVDAQLSGERTRPAIQPFTDSRGQQVWRAGRHVMF